MERTQSKLAVARAKGLGRTQRLVLHLLANGEHTARSLSTTWHGLSRSAAQSAVNRLGERGLVDLGRGGWARGHFVSSYRLTDLGREVEGLFLDDEAEHV